MVIMNPPFTRDTNHEAARANVANPMFAAFGMTDEQQREMARVSARLLRGTTAHGNAGEASAFLALADRKLKVGGTLAMVMPISLMLGDSWENSRGLLRKSYDDLMLVSIAGAGRKNDVAFSADTSIAECLVVGRKVEQSIRWHRAIFVVLYERPSSTMTGSSIASQIYKLKEGKLRKLEQGPVGGSLLHFGDDVIGYAIDASVPQEGPWNLARIRDCALAQLAYQMSHNSLVWLPGTSKKSAIPVSITTVSRVGKVGPVHRDINGNTPDGGIRGPFNVEPLKTQAAPTYPILWWHDANRERCMQFEADSEGIIRQGANPAEEAMVRKRVARVWATASHCHFNADFGFSSESTGMQFTERKSIGGRAWPSIALGSIEQEKALVLWSNSSLGLLLRWWHSNKQQPGRGSIGVSALTSLPVLDVTKLSGEALARMVAIFDDMKQKELKPVNEVAQDAVRAEIDTRLAKEVLGFPAELVAPDGPLALLRQKLALEPSITGSKSAC
jgi:hypothetical protein